jgi:hypothetical protein
MMTIMLMLMLDQGPTTTLTIDEIDRNVSKERFRRQGDPLTITAAPSTRQLSIASDMRILAGRPPRPM